MIISLDFSPYILGLEQLQKVPFTERDSVFTCHMDNMTLHLIKKRNRTIHSNNFYSPLKKTVSQSCDVPRGISDRGEAFHTISIL